MYDICFTLIYIAQVLCAC